MTHIRYIILDGPSRVVGRSTGVLRDAKNPLAACYFFHVEEESYTLSKAAHHSPQGWSFLITSYNRSCIVQNENGVGRGVDIYAIFVALVAKKRSGVWRPIVGEVD